MIIGLLAFCIFLVFGGGHEIFLLDPGILKNR